MLKRTDFCVKFNIGGVTMEECYNLPYRTEEEHNQNGSTIQQAASSFISKDLKCRRCMIIVLDIKEIHNFLIMSNGSI